MNRGLDRPLQLEPEKEYTIQIIADDKIIATVYIDGVALNARMYKKSGASLAIYVVDGALKVIDAEIETGLKSD